MQLNKKTISYENTSNSFSNTSNSFSNNINNNINTNEPEFFSSSKNKFKLDETLKSIQHKVSMNNIHIYFPYEPYENQISYMRSIIESLDNNNTILALESPRGTGKTLCLLCSTLAWVYNKKKTKNINYKIFYLSKNNNQLINVLNQLNQTIYRPKKTFISNKEFFCINENVKNKNNNKIIDEKCKCLIKEKKCLFYNNLDYVEDKNYINIEDLFKFAKNESFCPFFYEKNKINKNTDIIFLTYKFIFDKNLRKKFNIDIKNSIVIIDEAHNIKNLCEKNYTTQINIDEINECLNELTSIKINNSNLLKDSNEIDDDNNKLYENINNQINIIKNIKNNIENVKNVKNEGDSFPKRGKILTKNEFLNIFFNEKNNKNNENNNKNNNNKNYTISNLNSHINFLSNLLINQT